MFNHISTSGLFSRSKWHCWLLFVYLLFIDKFALVGLVEASMLIAVLHNRLIKNLSFSNNYSTPASLLAIFVVFAVSRDLLSSASWDDFFEVVIYYRKLIVIPFIIVFFQSRSDVLFIGLAFLFKSLFVLLLIFYGAVIGDQTPQLENYTTQSVFLILTIMIWINMREIGIKNPLVENEIFGVLFFLAVTVAVFGFSSSKTGYLYYFATFFSLYVIARERIFNFVRREKILFSIGLVCFLFIFVIAFDNYSHFATKALYEIQGPLVERSGGNSQGMRMAMWLNTLEIIKVNPIFGIGRINFADEYSALALSYTDLRAVESDDPHNQYLYLLASYGIIGLIMFVSIIGRMGLSGYLLGSSAFVSVVIGYLSMAFVNGVFFSFVEGRLFWVVFGLFCCQLRMKEYSFDLR